ncbi:M1 family metallopeptidase [Chondrinema litorale]|uniref:M1 family metallopeptidase n=1 Tax=Chondrinema litorale TaxID=2994555 RepID=UPI002543A662|nr:M1 family metallopeptidase [Chondrinema litorale]UZR94254.1 M1 family metallopeptidase [Chondrinema litorale]
MTIKNLITTSFLLFVGNILLAQTARWQQRVEYTMEIDMDVNTNQLQGVQKLVYFNNSPDTLKNVYYHLFFNAFQPGSMMDVRSRTIEDPDGRVRDRILHLSDSEIGYQKIKSLKIGGTDQDFEVSGTILEVTLAEPILPGAKTEIKMEFEAQVPLQIRRSGRDNREGIEYTMTQWFPKMAEYDFEGWHANPYIGREFHGVWGDFDVKINIDENYVVAGSGFVQNEKEVGHGYNGDKAGKGKNGKINWHFLAENVHDFAWAADPDYVHTIKQVPNGPELHFFYQADTLAENWEKLPDYTVQLFQIASEKYGRYPYGKYSVIQGGDGGMEYAQLTMITGHRSLRSLVGVTIHEAMHSWYQHVLGFNETKYSWMDEGFTSFASSEISNIIFDEKSYNPHMGAYNGYVSLVRSETQEPLTTHSDFYARNRTYGISAYSKGELFLMQLQYIVGKETFDKALLRFFYEWQFKHPNGMDIIRTFEKESGLQLKWFLEQWIGTVNSIDYSVKSVTPTADGKTKVILERIGNMPMPLDVLVSFENGQFENHYIPLRIMRGGKTEDMPSVRKVQEEDWPWTFPEYSFIINQPIERVKNIEIDPTFRMVDTERDNNVWPINNPIIFGESPSGK